MSAHSMQYSSLDVLNYMSLGIFAAFWQHFLLKLAEQPKSLILAHALPKRTYFLQVLGLL